MNNFVCTVKVCKLCGARSEHYDGVKLGGKGRKCDTIIWLVMLRNRCL